MTFTEIFTTYLAIGAPFGTYYFFKHRGELSSIALSIKSIGVVLTWFLFAAYLLRERQIVLKDSLLRTRWNISIESRIEEASQIILTIFAQVANSSHLLTYFEFRETLERFIGLTLASQQSSADSPGAKHESEVFRVLGHQPRALQLAEKISHRKNYLRLQLHQSFARQDFLRACLDLKEMLSAESSAKLETRQAYQAAVTQLFDLLKDTEAIRAFENLSESPMNISATSATVVSNEKTERDSWAVLSSKAVDKTFPMTVTSHSLISGTQD